MRTRETTFLSFFGGKLIDDDEHKKKDDISLDIFELFENTLASFISCWINESESYMSKDLCLSQNGILAYENNLEFQIDFQNDTPGMINEKKNHIGKQKSFKTIKNQIQLIVLNLFLKNPIQFMQRFLNLWLNENNNYISNDRQYKLSMIELLVSLNIPTEVILNSIYKNIDLDSIKNIKKSKTKYKDIYPFILSTIDCEYESKICQFIYSYIVYNTNQKTNINSIDIWRELINLLNYFSESKSPNTLSYTYEIINICLLKLNLKDTFSDKTIKSKLLSIIINLFNKNMDMFICNKNDVIFEAETKIILPMPPSIYEKVAKEIINEKIGQIKSSYDKIGINNSNKNKIKDNINSFKFNNSENITILEKERHKDQSLNDFYQSIHDYVSEGKVLKNEELLSIYRVIGFITLKNLFYSTMRFVFTSEKNDKMTIHVIYL
jgi:hypothetical protein